MNNGNLAICQKICADIVSSCRDKIESVYNYGSALNKHFSKKSDFDFLIILNDASPSVLASLRKVIEKYAHKNIKIDINVQTIDEMPQIRKEAFWHNNRGLFIQSEIENYGKLLFGSSQFTKKFTDIDQKMIKLESVRVLNSLVYQARKCLLNRELTDDEKYIFFKHCIYASMYALAAKEIFLDTYAGILKEFHRQFPNLLDPREFADKKMQNMKDVHLDDIYRAYGFLKSVDLAVFGIYQGEKND